MSVPVAPPDRLPRPGESLWKKAHRADYLIDVDTGCWVWQKGTIRGYPMGSGSTGTSRVHRAYYERAHGPIPPGHDIHHLCGNTRCINPAHLQAAHERDHDVEHALTANGYDFDFIRQVRSDRRAGMTIRSICRKYDLTYSTVQYWVNGASWSDVFGGAVVPEITKVCERVDCNNPVPGLARRPDKRFCSPNCRSVTNARKRRVEAEAA